MIEIVEKMKSAKEPNEKVCGGFRMTFENGNTISVQFGFGNYCENRDETQLKSENAEVAIWNKDGKWYDFGVDKVKGWCNADEVAQYINFARITEF